MESYTSLDLAMNKAEKEEKIIFYHDFGNNYDVESSYDYFVFHKFTTIENFCLELYNYCREKSDGSSRGPVDYEFPNYLTNDEFLIILDGWKNISVTNFPKDIDISKHEKEIMKYFKRNNKVTLK